MKRTSFLYTQSFVEDQQMGQSIKTVPAQTAIPIVTGWKKSWIHLKLKFTLLQVLMQCYSNPADWFRGLRYLVQFRRKVLGNHRLRKMIKVDKRYYMGLHAPGWNDASYRKFIASELYYFKPHNKPRVRFNELYLAITKKCPLQCEHCSAWDTLNMKDELGFAEYQQLIGEIEKKGVSSVYFTGGEPMVKFKLLQNLISGLSPDIRSWMSTSGFQFTAEKARLLKQAGLTGVFVSLDHYKEEKHNAFRNYKDAYSWALKAARNALDANLVVAFSICLSEAMSTEGELIKYLRLARDTGVHFVQFFEPRAVGHYKGKPVELSAEAIQRIEAFFLKLNFGKNHLDFPLISYHGFYQRRVGCFAAGKRVLYVDADGHVNACPFCQKSYGNLLEGELDDKLKEMTKLGCTSFS